MVESLQLSSCQNAMQTCPALTVFVTSQSQGAQGTDIAFMTTHDTLSIMVTETKVAESLHLKSSPSMSCY